jgi:SAM-dependent methyltransferase
MKTDDWLDGDALADAEPPLGVVRVWAPALKLSFERLNRLLPRSGSLLDSGGGDGSLHRFVRPGVDYVLLDRDEACIARALVPSKIIADALAMPFPDARFDAVISISTAQYIPHEKWLEECRRVLKPGGILALHENGSSNPIILLARMISFFMALRRPQLRAYNRTIRRYLDRPPAIPGLRIEYQQAFGLLSPAAFVLELLGARRAAERLGPILVRADETLLKLKPLRRLAWFRIFHLTRTEQEKTG